MFFDESQQLGSTTAKQGFENEREVISRFNQWPDDETVDKWLQILGHDPNDITFVTSKQVTGSYKADIYVAVKSKDEKLTTNYIQVKLVSNLQGYNQIDKRWVDRYKEMWETPDDICELLKLYTGELTPRFVGRDSRRMFADEFSRDEQKSLLSYLSTNKELILQTILQGRGKNAAEWLLVIQKINTNSKWALIPMSEAISYFGSGPIEITTRGSIKLGKITIQRKGGDGGRKTAQMLQFKINPADILS